MNELIEYLRGVAENANLPQYMRDRLTEAAAALEAAREDAWQPIETAPKDGTRVLLCCIGGAVWMGHWIGMSGVHAINGWTRFNCVDVGWNPDFWRPLPDPPRIVPEAGQGGGRG